MKLAGLPTDNVPAVLATGDTDVGLAFLALSTRDPAGGDADYIAWHSLDHHPEQYRLAGLRRGMRLVSTPACRAARAASAGIYDATDHVMTYLFHDAMVLPGFNALGRALAAVDRMPPRLPNVGYMLAAIAGRVAAPRAVAGAGVIPWRPSLGAYLIIEEGRASPAGLVEIEGVAGVWWYDGIEAPSPYDTDSRGLQISVCYLDDDPVLTAKRLSDTVCQRWISGEVRGLLAAPFWAPVPFDWARHLP